MIKTLSAIAVAAFIAAALTILPGFAPAVEASVPVALAKADRLDHVQPLLDRKQRLFAGIDPDGDDQPVAQADGVPDHIEVAVGDGVERAGIQGNTGHKPVYPAPQNPASGWFRPSTAPANLLFFNPFRTIGRVGASPMQAGDCFVPGWATKQISGATKPNSASAKTG